jgi:hypothetical protein
MPDEPEPKDLQEERTLAGLRIARTGRGCYLCHSSSHPERAYAVDVSAHGGLGSCECDDYLYRRYPRWKTVRQPFDSLRCRHLRAVRNHILDALIKHYADKPNQQLNQHQ